MGNQGHAALQSIMQQENSWIEWTPRAQGTEPVRILLEYSCEHAHRMASTGSLPAKVTGGSGFLNQPLVMQTKCASCGSAAILARIHILTASLEVPLQLSAQFATTEREKDVVKEATFETGLQNLALPPSSYLVFCCPLRFTGLLLNPFMSIVGE